MASKCRSCQAPILWTLDATTGRAQPLDAEPVANGNVKLTGRTGKTREGTTVPVSRVVIPQDSLFDDEPPVRYLNHFVTCPDAEEWKGGRP